MQERRLLRAPTGGGEGASSSFGSSGWGMKEGGNLFEERDEGKSYG